MECYSFRLSHEKELFDAFMLAFIEIKTLSLRPSMHVSHVLQATTRVTTSTNAGWFIYDDVSAFALNTLICFERK